jgi:hypothetical protein
VDDKKFPDINPEGFTISSTGQILSPKVEDFRIVRETDKIKLLRGALVGLVGESSAFELMRMRRLVEEWPAPEQDKVNLIRAIDVLIETDDGEKEGQ